MQTGASGTSGTNRSKRTTSRGVNRVNSGSSLNDLLDGESLTGGTKRSTAVRSSGDGYRLVQSPAIGGFASTPLFLNPLSTPVPTSGAAPLVSSAFIQQLLPPNSDLLTLLLSVSSHRSSQEGIIRAWMGNIDCATPPGRLRLLTGLGYILLDGNSAMPGSNSRPLTWTDIQYLKSTRDNLVSSGVDAAELVYLISVVLEDATQKDLSLKFRLENVLDFNDQITSRGWMDAGRDSDGTHSEELRVWFSNKCRNLGIELKQAIATHAQDLSPRATAVDLPGPRFSPTASDTGMMDPFSHAVVEQVFGNLETQLVADLDDVEHPITPKPRNPSAGSNDLLIREILVVDVQTDHSLRRHINKASELRKQFQNERVFVEELRKFIQRRVHFETPETRGAILKMAKSAEGFVHIGDVRTGAHSRHFAVLFKTLCDATGLYCRLVRGPNDVYYNVVMISDSNSMDELGNENKRDSNCSANREEVDEDQDDAEDVNDAPEELIPIFWEPTFALKKLKLTHPLDALLQKCNSASDPVDLDDFFVFDQLLGKGSFGEVWRVDLKVKTAKRAPGGFGNDGESVLIPGRVSTGPFALKLIPPEEADKEEASFMRIYSHARVINVIAVFRGYQVLENRKRELERKPAMCILMEMADKCLETVMTGSSVGGEEGSPKTNTPAPFKRLDLRFVFRILIDSARAMAYLHSPVGQRPHLVHRDLKPGNVLISSDGRAIVTDFGVARMNPSLETNLTVGAGTEGYMAPEQKTLLYDRPADVYSFGVVIARILGTTKWKDAINLVIDDFDESTADPVLVQLCLKCVQFSPLHRPSFEQLHQVLLCEFVRREFSRTVLGARAKQVGPVIGQNGAHGGPPRPSKRIPGDSKWVIDAPQDGGTSMRRNPSRKPAKTIETKSKAPARPNGKKR